MKKTYILGLPLFHVLFYTAMQAEAYFLHLEAASTPDPDTIAPATLSLFVFMFLLYGGYFLLSFIYGYHLFSKLDGSGHSIALYTFLTLLISLLFIFTIYAPSHPHISRILFIVIPQETFGFLIGAAIAHSRSRKRAEQNS